MSDPSPAESSSTPSKRAGSPLLSGLPAKRPAAAVEEISEEDALNFLPMTQPQGSQASPTPARQKTKKEKRNEKRATDRRNLTPWHSEVGEEGAKEGEGKGKARAADSDEEAGDEGESKTKLPKRKVALLVGYCGTGYSGMQIQKHGSKTIEGDIFEALIKAGAISEDNSVDPRKVDVSRAARTDAGVHAAGNVISLKMLFGFPLPEGISTPVEYINSLLSPQIRVWGYQRTLKSFAARTSCDTRKYEYLFPTYCLLPPQSIDPLAKQLDASSPGWRDTLGPGVEFVESSPYVMEAKAGQATMNGEQVGREVKETSGAVQGKDKAREDGQGEGNVGGVIAVAESKDKEDGADGEVPSRREFERRRGWRVDQGTLERFREIVDQYTGTHNFHNYTVQKPFNDRSVKRHMLKLEVRDPQVYGEIEWISVSIHGQSFMLHQIRKMISMAMLCCRTNTPAALLPETFGPKKIYIPKAPPLGLLLEAPQFGTYNLRATELSSHEHILWEKYESQIHDFKVKMIYEKLREEEYALNVFHKWQRQMDTTTSDQLAFLNTRGIIPSDISSNQPKKPAVAGTGDEANGAMKKEREDYEDEELDPESIKRGDLEG